MRIVLDQVAKNFGPQQALLACSLELAPGDIVAVLGLAGGGKTTLLACLAGILAVDAGEIRIDGNVFQRRDLAMRKRLMFVPKHPSYLPEHCALDHLAMVLRLYGRESAVDGAAVAAVLDAVGLLRVAELPLTEFVHGDFYRLAVAALALAGPELWLLDDPFTAGMDAPAMAAMKDLAKRAAAGGATVLFSCARAEDARGFATRALVMECGQEPWSLTMGALAMMPKEGPDSLDGRMRARRDAGR